MKRFSQLLCVLLVIAVTFSVPVFALDNNNSRASSYFASSDVYLYRTSSTQFEAWFEVTALGGMDKLGASEIKIQRSSDDENWSTVWTCTKDSYSRMICENTGFHGACVTYNGDAGYYYRAKITLYAENSSGIGEWVRYTDSILM